MKKKIIITIPAYNEARNIGNVIKNIKLIMDKTKYKYKILVVNDGSKDRTAHIAQKAGAIVKSHHTNLGLAQAFRTEMKECIKLGADIIVHTDADGQYLASQIPLLINKVEEGYDLVLGSRFAGKIESMPFTKYWGNKAFSKVISKIVKKRVTDGQTGFRAFTKNVAEEIELISNYTYTQEQIIKAFKNNYKIIEIPIYFAKRHGKSRLMSNPIQYAIKSWITILRIYRDYKPLKFFGSTGMFIMGLGILLGLWLFLNFLTTGKVGRLPSTILSMLLIVSGLQIIIFGFLADMKKN